MSVVTTLASNPSARVTAVILAGGRGSRMHGQDKGLLALDGRPLVEHVLERVRPQVDEVVISANRNLDRYASYNLRVVPDVVHGHPGPLAGLLSAMRQIDDGLIQLVPCDSPAVSRQLVARLKTPLLENAARIALPDDGVRLQPLFSLLDVSLRENLEHAVRRGELKAVRWMTDQKHIQVDFSDTAGSFINLNTPDEFHGYHYGT
ncbi:MAG: molybdenum cofactor guanylyltransferase MobA [Gammaproteobacteria bacterium]|jgi:molybdopterin-guanine dinucleotide biosynthesis protein A